VRNSVPVAPFVAPLSPLAGRNVFVTGGTGSFGTAFVKRALLDGARRVVVYSRDELKQATLRAGISDPRLRCFIGDVRDRHRLETAMHGVDIVVHAAAIKRIEVCEANPDEAIRTNVLGTLNVAQAAIAVGVDRAVFLSTDKAPDAATLYGATKFCAERMWIASNVHAAGRKTRLSAVRYGNVLASRGSVMHLWREQRQQGIPLTLTDARCTRFWLTLDQAVDLVILCLRTMRGGEVVIPKAPSSPIGALADAVAGHWPYEELGLRPAERLHETLISVDESRNVYDAGSHYIIEPPERTWATMEPPPYPRVPDGWSYRSDTNELQATADDLRRLVA
jgi:UDP-N-acetylglucosamine 4,6-dehydratase